MKNQITNLIIILFVITGITGCRHSGTEDALITIEVTASYPERKLILQDFLDVEYIPLETNDELVTQGVVMATGSKYIIVKNRSHDGDIFVFDRNTGKAVRKINRKGNGPEEYIHVTDVVLEEENNELFVNCISTKKIFVYDLFGNFKRSFNHTEETRYMDVFNYDRDNLICYNELVNYKAGENRESELFHLVVSKQDGSITRNISIPFDVINPPVVEEGNGTVVTSVPPIIPYHDGWLLIETSSDTVYNYLPKKNKLTSFLVKSPASNPEILLTMGTITERYYFFTTMKKVFDFSTGRGFPVTELMYDKQENAVYDCTVINGDFVKRKTVDMNSHPVNNEIAAFQTIDAYQIVEAFKNDGLKGRLKEIAAGLNEESNPVIMVMKY
ncbi:MAG: 6-bladed beta-propeller [Bacteroidota bacterium]